MINRIKKNLIHFYTHGNITEDFVASRRKKVLKLRRVIRVCFYAHCVAALLCFAISFVFGTDRATIIITAATLILAWLAFFAAGNNMPVKIVLFTGDFLFSAGLITWGALHTPGAVFFICGGIVIVSGLFGIVSYIAALCKQFLAEFQPRNIRRTDYTLYTDMHFDLIPDQPLEKKQEDIPSLPPLTSEMRVLANKLKEIICDNDKSDK